MLKIGNFGIGKIKNKSADGDYFISMQQADELFGRFNPYAIKNYYTTFKEVGEVQFPIKFICDRAKNAKFVLKKWSDDSVVWENKQINKFLENPNPFYSFKDLVSYYIQMKLVLGNAFLYANVVPSFSRTIWKYCDSYYILPSQFVTIDTKKVNPFSVDSISEIVNEYQLARGNGIINKLNPNVVLHSRDFWDFEDTNNSLLSFSRLSSQKYTLANLVAVYEARNVIYTKRGALGAIVSKASDAGGLLPMTDEELKTVRETFQKNYGFDKKKDLFTISQVPIDFVKFGASISELQPFKETFNDAVQIAGIFGVNKELIPREDNSTFSNQKAAEVSVYNNTVIPIVNTFLSEINNFLGLNESGFYIDADWSDVDVLQEGDKQEQEKKNIISERCRNDFRSGIITLNDWRTALGMEAIEKPLYTKTTIEMSEGELNELKRILDL